MIDIGTHAFAVLVGIFVGAIGEYYAQLLTDRRRLREATHGRVNAFNKVKEAMPDLIMTMKRDLSGEDSAVREFFVSPHAGVAINSRQPRFRYYETEHQNLRGKVATLKNCGYILDVTSSNVSTYQFTEDFVELILMT